MDKEVLLSSATYAAVGHLVEVIDVVALGVLHEGGFETHLRTELVLNNAYLRVELWALDHSLDQRRLPCAQEPSYDYHSAGTRFHYHFNF